MLEIFSKVVSGARRLGSSAVRDFSLMWVVSESPTTGSNHLPDRDSPRCTGFLATKAVILSEARTATSCAPCYRTRGRLADIAAEDVIVRAWRRRAVRFGTDGLRFSPGSHGVFDGCLVSDTCYPGKCMYRSVACAEGLSFTPACQHLKKARFKIDTDGVQRPGKGAPETP